MEQIRSIRLTRVELRGMERRNCEKTSKRDGITPRDVRLSRRPLILSHLWKTFLWFAGLAVESNRNFSISGFVIAVSFLTRIRLFYRVKNNNIRESERNFVDRGKNPWLIPSIFLRLNLSRIIRTKNATFHKAQRRQRINIFKKWR